MFVKKTKKGEFGAIMSIIPIAIVLPVCVMMLCLYVAQSIKENVQDALTLSCLAGALIDTKEYAETNNIVVETPVKTYQYFQEYMKKNLSLAGDMSPKNENSFITGPIIVKDFIVYSKYDDKFYVSDVLHESAESQQWEDGRIVTNPSSPDGKNVTKTSVYANIEFPMRTMFGIEITAHIHELIAIE